MSVLLKDYKVQFRDEEDLAKTALTWRETARNHNLAYFNIVSFVEDCLRVRFTAKGRLVIHFFDAVQGEDRAYVTFNPLTLHIDNETWELAKLGDPEARFIVAHEVGHLLLHDHHAKAFSNDPKQQIKFVQREDSAEWQANTFASHFLLPSHLVSAFASASELAAACSVTKQLAEDRFDVVMQSKLHAMKYAQPRNCEGDPCDSCGNFTLIADGSGMRCKYCGHRRCHPKHGP